MNITTLMIAMLVFSGVILGLVAYYGDIITVYAPENSTSTEEFQKFNQTFYDYTDMMSNIENKTVSFNILHPETWGDGGLAFLSVAGIIYKTPGLLTATIQNLLASTKISFPPWLLPVIIGGITIFVVMKVASIFLRRYGGDI
jgi:hypothetical protein